MAQRLNEHWCPPLAANSRAPQAQSQPFPPFAARLLVVSLWVHEPAWGIRPRMNLWTDHNAVSFRSWKGGGRHRFARNRLEKRVNMG